MLHDQLTKNLKPGEQLLRMVRRDILGSLRPLLIASFLILTDFFFLAWLLQYRGYGLLAFFVVLVIAIIVALRAIVEWRLNALVLTSERAIHIHQHGFFTRTVAEATYDKITDVRSAVRGPLQTILGLGSIELQTPGEGEDLRLTGVREPAKVQACLTTTIRTARGSASPLSADELVRAIARAKDELGDEAFAAALRNESKRSSPDR